MEMDRMQGFSVNFSLGLKNSFKDKILELINATLESNVVGFSDARMWFEGMWVGYKISNPKSPQRTRSTLPC
jgi:hypothetical protein